MELHTWNIATQIAEGCAKDLFLYPEDHTTWPEADRGIDQGRVTAKWVADEIKTCMRLHE